MLPQDRFQTEELQSWLAGEIERSESELKDEKEKYVQIGTRSVKIPNADLFHQY